MGGTATSTRCENPTVFSRCPCGKRQRQLAHYSFFGPLILMLVSFVTHRQPRSCNDFCWKPFPCSSEGQIMVPKEIANSDLRFDSFHNSPFPPGLHPPMPHPSPALATRIYTASHLLRHADVWRCPPLTHHPPPPAWLPHLLSGRLITEWRAELLQHNGVSSSRAN